MEEERAIAWQKAREHCGELKGELCKKRFRENLTPGRRTLHAMDDKYEGNRETSRTRPNPRRSFGRPNLPGAVRPGVVSSGSVSPLVYCRTAPIGSRVILYVSSLADRPDLVRRHGVQGAPRRV